MVDESDGDYKHEDQYNNDEYISIRLQFLKTYYDEQRSSNYHSWDGILKTIYYLFIQSYQLDKSILNVMHTKFQ